MAMAAVVMMCLALALPSTASAATQGVVGFFGEFGTSGGQFSQPLRGVAVQSSTGDVFVVDSGNQRVQRFSADGVFERAWGKDVVIAGRPGDTGTGAEVCTVAADCKGGVIASVDARGGEFAFGTNGNLDGAGIAIDQSDGFVFVSERFNRRVQQFTADGVFVRAWGRDVVKPGGAGDVVVAPIVANERQAVSLSSNGPFDFGCFCFPDVTGGTFTLSFDPDGVGAQPVQTTGPIPYNATAAVVDQRLEDDLAAIGAGEVTVTGGPGGPSTAPPWTVEFTGGLGGVDQAQMTGSGAGLVPSGSTVGVATVQQGSTTPGVGPFEVCTVATDCKTGAGGTLGGEFASNMYGRLAVAPATAPNAGDVIVGDGANARVQEFNPDAASASQVFVRAFGWNVVSPGGTGDDSVAPINEFEICTVAAECRAGAAGTGVGQFATNLPSRVAVDSTGAIYTSENTANFRMQKFTPQAGPPALAPSVSAPGFLPAPSSQAGEIAIGADDHVFVTRRFAAGASTCPSGAASSLETRVVEFTPTGAEAPDSPHMTCAGLELDGLGINPANERMYATSTSGGIPRVYTSGISTAPTVAMGVGGVSTHTATLNGIVTPNGPGTTTGARTGYHFEYRKVGDPWPTLTTDIDVGNGFAGIPVSLELEALEANTSYEARLVATKLFTGGAIVSPVSTFTTPASRPDIDTVYTTDRDSTSATLNARINPNGETTTYRFEYGTTAAYGTTVPIPDASAGASSSPQVFSQAISGLAPDTTYHYRVIATNAKGTNTSSDHTFTTRAATPAPDGRAYEIVSPPDKVGGSGLSVWYAGVGSHGMAGLPALEGDRYISISYYGATLADGGHSYGSDVALGERAPTGWVNKPGFTRPGAIVTSELAKLPLPTKVSADLSLSAWTANSQMQLFAEQAEVWGVPLGSAPGAALRGWESDKWEILAPLAPGQGGGDALAVAPGGGYALAAGLFGVAGPGDPTNPAFTGSPGDLISGSGIYLDDVTAGLSDSFPGAGIRSLVNVCTGAGSARTAIPSVDAGGKVSATPCPDALPGRDARLISSGGASVAANGEARGVISEDGSRVFFISPDHTVAATTAPCAGVGAVDTRCPAQVYVRQRNPDGSVATRWISESAVAGQDASLLAAAVFEGATPDGDKAFFRTASPLTADDPNGGPGVPGGVRSGVADPQSVDLYMYDFPDAPGADPGAGTLTRISAGPTGNGDANVSTDSISSPTRALRAFGEDGSRVYFTTAAPLPGVPAPADGTITTPGGSRTQSATRNLYAYDAARPVDERWRFVARLPLSSLFGRCAASGARDGDALIPDLGATGLGGKVQVDGNGMGCVRVSADGGFVTFFTDGRLTGDDPDAVTGDVYGYDAETDELSRLSAAQSVSEASYVCVTNDSVGSVGAGTRCHGDPVIHGLGMQSPLGVVTDPAVAGERVAFFESASRLVAEDHNDVYDVYQWRDGMLSLISTGAVDAQDALYRGNDGTGKNVYISTRDRLTWQDHDAGLDVYDARAGGGFPAPVAPVVCDVLAGGCHGGAAGPVTPPVAETRPLTGSDDATVGRRKALSLGRVSAAQRRRASRSGVLRVSVRATAAGRVRVVVRGRVGKRTRRVAVRSIRLAEAGRATLRLRLSRPARVRLRQGRSLRLTVKAISPGARSRAIAVLLPGARS
jgi:hypothetical protein